MNLMPAFFSSLQFRLALGFFLALAVALALIGVATGVSAGRHTERFDRDRDLAQAARLRHFVADYYDHRKGWARQDAAMQESVERAGGVFASHIVVYDANGAVIANSHPGLLAIEGLRNGKTATAPFKTVKKIPIRLNGKEVGALTVSEVPVGAMPPLGIAEPTADRISGEVNRSLFWAGIGAAIVGIALVWLLSRRTLAPLQALGTAARRLGRGDFSQRADAAGPSEIRELALNFNAMAAELEEAEQHRRNLTADIAHELRTPLSNIQGYLEAIKDGVVQPTPETIDTIHGQALHLSALVEDLRLLAQVEAGALQLERTPADVEELLRSAVEAVRPRAEERGVSVAVEAAPSLPVVDLDTTRLAQVLSNLLENAITHTPEGGAVNVSARSAAAQVEIAVADTGPGIAPEDLPRVFDRFYRADPSRSRSTGGSGLGLTIARRLAEAHGGSLTVDSAVGQGSTFTVTIPTGK